jgi:beta-N-acetylhexosaminidase
MKMANKGRMIVSIAGYTLTEIEREMLSHPMLAGIILFTQNYKNKDQVRTLIAEIEAIADLPIFIDQEGGYVQRFGRGFTSLPAPKVFGIAYDIDHTSGLKLAETYGGIMAEELSEFGIINLGPVCDLDAGNLVITGLSRSFHLQPKACSELLFAFTKGMREHGMCATGKHFPGHGQNNGDTHDNVVVDHRTLEEIEQNDLVPFIDLIKANQLAAIMPAHIIYTQVDPSHTAGSSKIWLNDLLRIKYGFNGVIVSDCLSMKGAGDGSLLDKTEQALSFGDVAIMCHRTPEEFISLLDALQEKGYELDTIGQERFARWIEGSVAARSKIGAKFARGY